MQVSVFLIFITRGVQFITEYFRFYVVWCAIIRISRDLLSCVKNRCSKTILVAA